MHPKIAAYISVSQHAFDEREPSTFVLGTAAVIYAVAVLAMIAKLASMRRVHTATGRTRAPPSDCRTHRRPSTRISPPNRRAPLEVTLSAAPTPSQENDMFEFETSMSRPSAHELHMRARREQARVVNAFLSRAARKLVEWLGILARNATMLARQLAAEWRLRRDIHMLRQLHDRDLSDMGLGRGEITSSASFVTEELHGQRASRPLYPGDH